MAAPCNMKMHDRRGRQKKQKPSESVQLDEVDRPIGSGPCDGYEAGRLLGLYGKSAVDAICERVAKGVEDERDS